MTILSDFIAQNSFQAWQAVQTDARWLYLKDTADTVDELVILVNALGWETVEQAESACAVLNTLVDPVTPVPALPFDRDDLPTVSWMELNAFIARETSTAPNTHVKLAPSYSLDLHWSDETYGLLTKAQIQKIAAASPSSGFDFQDPNFDCDDFCRVMYGWLAEVGLGNAAVGLGTMSIYDNDVLVGAHIALIAVDTNHSAWWIEPQNGHVYDVQDVYMIPGADRMLITDLYF